MDLRFPAFLALTVTAACGLASEAEAPEKESGSAEPSEAATSGGGQGAQTSAPVVDSGTASDIADARPSDSSFDAATFDPARTAALIAWFAADKDVVTAPGSTTISGWKDQVSGALAAPLGLCAPPVRIGGAAAKPMVSLGSGQCIGLVSAVRPPATVGVTILIAMSMDATVPAPAPDEFAGRLLSLYGASSYFDITRAGVDRSAPYLVALPEAGPAQVFTMSAPGTRTFAPGSRHVLSFRVDASPGQPPTAEFRVDGVVTAMNTRGTPPIDYSFRTLRIGAGNNPTQPNLDSYFGSVGEVMVFGRGLQAAEREGAETYLKHRWNP